MFVDDANDIKAGARRYGIDEANGYVNEIDGVLTAGSAQIQTLT